MNKEELSKICNKSTSDCIEVAKQLKEKDKEIEKLNNIINELEKDIRNKLKEYNRLKCLKNPTKSKIAEFKEEVFDYVLYKLKKLKESK